MFNTGEPTSRTIAFEITVAVVARALHVISKRTAK